jgi:diguanylate cyclase (GGDEF)-like protein
MHLVAVAGAWFLIRTLVERNYYRDEYRHLWRTVPVLAQQLRAKQDEVDVLAALREVSLAIGRGDDADTSLSSVLATVGTFANAENVSLFIGDDLDDPDSPKVELVRSWKPGRETRSAGEKGDIRPHTGVRVDAPDIEPVLEALVHRRIYESVDGDRVTLTFPFSTQEGQAGSMLIHRRFSGGIEAGQRQLAHFAAQTKRFVGHVALALRTLSLQRLATIDGLTGLHVKREWGADLARTHAAARRKPGPDTRYSVVLFDIDHFKKVNDTFGHLSGDLVLQGVARTITEASRGSARGYRIGGEEMAMLVTGAACDHTVELAEAIRKAIGRAPYKGENGVPVPVTISVGVCDWTPEFETPEQVVSLADRALYTAKNTGRDRVVVERPMALATAMA